MHLGEPIALPNEGLFTTPGESRRMITAFGRLTTAKWLAQSPLRLRSRNKPSNVGTIVIGVMFTFAPRSIGKAL